MNQLEPSYTYGSDVNTGLRRRLEDLQESTFRARKIMQEGAFAAKRLSCLDDNGRKCLIFAPQGYHKG